MHKAGMGELFIYFFVLHVFMKGFFFQGLGLERKTLILIEYFLLTMCTKEFELGLIAFV